MKIGILGCGGIFETFINGVNAVPEASCVAVASRDLSRAQEFAKRFQIDTAYGSYLDLMKDEQVEAVYIASPHSHHYEHMQLCIEHGKHILCEKAFTVNAKQAKSVLALAKEKNLFVLEGMWPRFFPIVPEIQKVLADELVGKAKALSLMKCYHIFDHKDRLNKPELAGGALLDLGCYVLNFASMFLGNEVESIHSAMIPAGNGVDLQESFVLKYKDGKTAMLTTSMGCTAPEIGIIACERGYIQINDVAMMPEALVYNEHRELVRSLKAEPFTNFQYEIAAMAKALAEGRTECAEMPHETTIFIMEQMDELRKQWGMVLPCE